MARSQLLKDMVSGTSKLETILLRLKIIFTDLEDRSVLKWINGEIEGYKDNEVPSYRVLKGEPKGTYTVNFYEKYTNAPVPLKHVLTSELVDELSTLEIKDGLVAIQNILKSKYRNKITKTIPTELCDSISKPKFKILSMHISFSLNQFDSIVSIVKSKLTEVIMMLEKTFDNIDELDISSQIKKDPSIREMVIYNIQHIIFDKSLKYNESVKYFV
ncbi:AbiTii domain-containing protein [Bacillus chungangensis]|uniref:AbiTii domain-containing protein n=1 Tax=Bacillus chungangensis TaxID=587633 RepID=A0ABT9WNY3_9BACI|nr:hypothetical protein [Bacillus chungangensis]MDQ0174986.1 hypothetical protein [Bacillus chungangensis]